MEEIVLPGDGEDIGVPRHDPERVIALGPRDPERIVGAQPAVSVVNAVVGVSARIDQRRGDVGGNVEVLVLHRLSLNKESAKTLVQRMRDAMRDAAGRHALGLRLKSRAGADQLAFCAVQ